MLGPLRLQDMAHIAQAAAYRLYYTVSVLNINWLKK